MTNVTPESIFQLTPQASIQSVGDGAVVLLADSGQLFTCNETTEAFLTKVDGRRRLSEIIALVGDEFEVEASEVASDLSDLARQLIDEKIIQHVA